MKVNSVGELETPIKYIGHSNSLVCRYFVTGQSSIVLIILETNDRVANSSATNGREYLFLSFSVTHFL